MPGSVCVRLHLYLTFLEAHINGISTLLHFKNTFCNTSRLKTHKFYYFLIMALKTRHLAKDQHSNLRLDINFVLPKSMKNMGLYELLSFNFHVLRSISLSLNAKNLCRFQCSIS